MPYDFLDRLDLKPDERKKLLSLMAQGSDTAFKLLALKESSPAAFSGLLGTSERAEEIAQRLRGMLTDDERALLAAESPKFATGALLDPPARN